MRLAKALCVIVRRGWRSEERFSTGESARAPDDIGTCSTRGSAPARNRARSFSVLCGFFLRFLVVFVLLIAPWAGVSELYSSFFRAGGDLLFSKFGSDGRVRFLPMSNPDEERDMEVVLINRRTRSEMRVVGSSRLQGYKPTAFVLALILATPVPWSRRWRAAGWGLVLVNLYVAVKQAVFLLSVFSGENSLALFSPGPVCSVLLDLLVWILVMSFAGWLIVPLPIWALVTFRRSDWPTILQAPGRKPDAGA